MRGNEISFRIGSSVSACKYLKRIGVQEEAGDKYCTGTESSIKTTAEAGRSMYTYKLTLIHAS
jgi:hypothetical protein